ncbi:NAD(P)-dependent dehydrogenase, short-chain alcohol dehydrogenase family [Paenibacillus algorifonticola]|uniref:NAD(P)-dependent dehydrogenase, short-chain alcohol dehydrogenase family n=1 Tax=Paenibacillus algorifonticola TaxID=684063 RepID=A0A1I2F521_9BACL|nr:SDR family NAD(P)-dependent oxidoreductase [Paenibacillus algorifonticola]SFF00069.1 NAD(P)-dependent dehydrogenase, short-chain alcohol dehydrogenase family [Paenibacillus algorifonticola]
MKLENKVIIITGAGSGIGRATALKLAAEGAIVVSSDYNEATAKETAELIKQAGGQASAIRADVSSVEDVKNMIDKAVETHGTLDGIFNNAGVGDIRSFEDHTPEYFNHVISVDQFGVYLGIYYASKKMKELGVKGIIVNTASIFGYMAAKGSFAYQAAKAAVVMMTKSAALELADAGIRVTAVAPGFIDTPIIKDGDDFKNFLAEQHLSKKLIQPEQIADVVAFLFSEEASAINGQTIPVEDGFLIFKRS